MYNGRRAVPIKLLRLSTLGPLYCLSVRRFLALSAYPAVYTTGRRIRDVRTHILANSNAPKDAAQTTNDVSATAAISSLPHQQQQRIVFTDEHGGLWDRDKEVWTCHASNMMQDLVKATYRPNATTKAF